METAIVIAAVAAAVGFGIRSVLRTARGKAPACACDTKACAKAGQCQEHKKSGAERP